MSGFVRYDRWYGTHLSSLLPIAPMYPKQLSTTLVGVGMTMGLHGKIPIFDDESTAALLTVPI